MLAVDYINIDNKDKGIPMPIWKYANFSSSYETNMSKISH